MSPCQRTLRLRTRTARERRLWPTTRLPGRMLCQAGSRPLPTLRRAGFYVSNVGDCCQWRHRATGRQLPASANSHSRPISATEPSQALWRLSTVQGTLKGVVAHLWNGLPWFSNVGCQQSSTRYANDATFPSSPRSGQRFRHEPHEYWVEIR